MGCILTTAYRWIWRHDRILRATLFLAKPFGDHSPFSVSENPNFGWFVPRSGSLVTGGWENHQFHVPYIKLVRLKLAYSQNWMV